MVYSETCSDLLTSTRRLNNKKKRKRMISENKIGPAQNSQNTNQETEKTGKVINYIYQSIQKSYQIYEQNIVQQFANNNLKISQNKELKLVPETSYLYLKIFILKQMNIENEGEFIKDDLGKQTEEIYNKLINIISKYDKNKIDSFDELVSKMKEKVYDKTTDFQSITKDITDEYMKFHNYKINHARKPYFFRIWMNCIDKIVKHI